VAKSTTESSQIVDEAIRAISGASTKSAADAERVFESARSSLEHTVALNRQIGTALSTGLEANLKAGFAMQTALLTASQSLLETAAAANKTALAQWLEVTEQAQAALLDGVHTGTGLFFDTFLVSARR
jgi:hypothetical protein